MTRCMSLSGEVARRSGAIVATVVPRHAWYVARRRGDTRSRRLCDADVARRAEHPGAVPVVDDMRHAAVLHLEADDAARRPHAALVVLGDDHRLAVHVGEDHAPRCGEALVAT